MSVTTISLSADYTMEKPTGALRWLYNPGTSTVPPKLQQEIFVTYFLNGKEVSGCSEWRDIPHAISEVPFQ